MIDAEALLDDAQKVTSLLVDDLRQRTEDDEQTRASVRGTYAQAQSAGRTDRSWEDWRDDLLAQVASGWTLATVFVRFCEDNGLVDTPLLSGPGDRRGIARDHRSAFLADNRTAGDREWLVEVFSRYAKLPGVSDVFGDRNPLWQVMPGPDGARALLELWWETDDEGRETRHDFTDPDLDTRFLGDLYQDLSEHARKQFALLQTPHFIESFILDRTLDPAIETFGLTEVRMIDPTCGSGHFLLGALDRLMHRWQEREPGTSARELAQRALDAVNGVDLNSFAVAIARFRLLVAALRASEIQRLEDAPNFHVNVATGDSLLHGTRSGTGLAGTEGFGPTLAHHYPTEDAEQADAILQADRYHAVVANPPYITVKDKALNRAYRALYSACHRQYALTVPFMQRLHDLAVPAHRDPVRGTDQPAGYVGQITSNSFMKREFGKKVIEEHLAERDLTHVIDTSGAYIPGHGTPTVILFSRDQPSRGVTRAVLGIRGEPGRPNDPAKGKVWTAVTRQVDHPGSESDYVSVEDFTDGRLNSHPWSLQGGAAPNLVQAIGQSGECLSSRVDGDIGRAIRAGSDELFMLPWHVTRRMGVSDEVKGLAVGTEVRDWSNQPSEAIWYPYPLRDRATSAFLVHRWGHRTFLANRATFQGKMADAGLAWWEYMQHTASAYETPLSIVFAFVATHNHFVLDRGGKVFKQSAPVIKLPEGASEEEHLALLGLLNSSAACFWMKQVFHNKGSTIDKAGARQTTIPFEDFYEFDSTKLKQFPVPDGAPTAWARRLDSTAQQLARVLPAAVAKREAPTAATLAAVSAEGAKLRAEMVAMQEELDWECYRLYGLIDEDLTCPVDELPPVQKGERAFEIALARRMAAGEATSSWFERHDSTPITEIPSHWPDRNRRLVERRLELIESDRAIRLLERPEYKRRWNWDAYEDLAEDAQEQWLLDEIEEWLKEQDPSDPQPTTIARIADRLAADDTARQVAEDLAGTGADLVRLVDRLVRSAGVAYLAAHRFKPSGLRRRAEWEQVWELQRIEDDIDARTRLPEDDPRHLSESDAAVARKDAGVDRIPVPPKYRKGDFRDNTTWKLRGKLDVPKERFVLYPDTHLGADATLVFGWAGWDHLQQARALAGLYTTRTQDGAERPELARLLAGVAELVPWLKQWHNDPDPVYGERMGNFFAEFVDGQTAGLDLTADDLSGEAPLLVEP